MVNLPTALFFPLGIYEHDICGRERSQDYAWMKESSATFEDPVSLSPIPSAVCGMSCLHDQKGETVIPTH